MSTTPTTVSSLSQRTRPLRVVIIDDTSDLRDVLRLALVRGGMDVVAEAEDGVTGIEAVRLERPDVVLLDLSMPVMDGLEALPSIRRLAPQAKIIVLSGFGATQMSERAMTMGADGYLQKGLALRRILEYVREIADATPALVPTAAGEDRNGLRGLKLKRAKDESTGAAVRDALALAPYGVLEVADEPLFPIVYANPAAQRMFQSQARVGVALGTVASELTSMVAYNRLEDEASFPVTLDGRLAHATLRRAGKSLLVYLDSSTDDAGMLRRAIATTAHEIRGPVSVLRGVAETITKDADILDDEERSQLMSSVARQARTLDVLSADLLSTAQIQRGTLSLDVQEVDLAPVIDTVLAEHDQVTVAVQIDDARRVKADPLKLEQMLGNLVGNAVKYGRAPLQLRVHRSALRPDLVAIDVVDAGDGLPDGFHEQLFREFARAAGTVGTGTGLGLYVVRALARAHGGDATYAPGPQGGAVFTVTLPAV